MMSNSSILVLGMEDYVIILYDIIDYKIIKFISLVEYLEGERHFYVNAIVPLLD